MSKTQSSKVTRHLAILENVSFEWPSFWTDISDDPPSSFWLTLVADRGPEGRIASHQPITSESAHFVPSVVL
jgi:hypothetical protein